MDLCADKNISGAVVSLLRGASFSVDTPRTLNTIWAKDTEILATAALNKLTLVTHDKDFLTLHEIWVDWRAAGCVSIDHSGIVRLPGGNARIVSQRLQDLLTSRQLLPNQL